VISSVVSTNIPRNNGSLLSGAASSGFVSELNDANTEPQSFQSVFSQIASSGAAPQAVRDAASDYSYGNLTSKPTTDTSLSQPTPTSGFSANNNRSASTQISTENLNHSRSAAPVGPRRSNKQDTISHSAQIGKNQDVKTAGVSDLPNSPVTDLCPCVASAAAPATVAKKPLPGNVPSQNALPISAANALGGLKSLSGSAFALHITASGNAVNSGLENANQENLNQGSANHGDENTSALIPAPDGAPPIPSSASVSSASSPLAFMQNGAIIPLAVSPLPLNSSCPTASSGAQSDPTPSGTTLVTASEIPDQPTAAPQTVHTVQMQLGGDGQSRVDVRLVEHAGGLSVSVRASDSVLARGLQENLPDLSARLAAEKYQTHTFLPTNENSNGGSTSSSSEQSSDQSNEQSGSQTSWRGGDGGSRQQNGQSGGEQRQKQEYAWWRQMAAMGKLSSSTSNSISDSQPSQAANSAVNQ